MLMYIQDFNRWENERWPYVFDLTKQSAAAIKYLMIFIELANRYHDECEKSAPEPMYIPFCRSVKIFAASRYSYDFFDDYTDLGKGRYHLIKKGVPGVLSINTNKDYKSGKVDMSLKISPQRMKSAMLAMREKRHDKKENKLYKAFESVFLSNKKITAV